MMPPRGASWAMLERLRAPWACAVVDSQALGERGSLVADQSGSSAYFDPDPKEIGVARIWTRPSRFPDKKKPARHKKPFDHRCSDLSPDGPNRLYRTIRSAIANPKLNRSCDSENELPSPQ